MKKFVLVDIETSGQNSKIHDIIQLGAVKLNTEFDIVDQFSVYVKPLSNSWCKTAENVHKLSKEFVLQNGLECNLAFEKFELWVGENVKEYILAAWGTYFDINFLVQQYEKINRPYPFLYRTLDVASVVRFYIYQFNTMFPSEQKAARFFNIEFDDDKLHNGLYDAQLAAKLLKEVHNKIKTYEKI